MFFTKIKTQLKKLQTWKIKTNQWHRDKISNLYTNIIVTSNHIQRINSVNDYKFKNMTWTWKYENSKTKPQIQNLKTWEEAVPQKILKLCKTITKFGSECSTLYSCKCIYIFISSIFIFLYLYQNKYSFVIKIFN